MARRKLTIAPDGRIVVIRGYKVADIARAAGLRPTYSASAGGWMLDASKLPELVAWLEYRNFRYEVQNNRDDDRHETPEVEIPAPRTERESTLW